MGGKKWRKRRRKKYYHKKAALTVWLKLNTLNSRAQYSILSSTRSAECEIKNVCHLLWMIRSNNLSIQKLILYTLCMYEFREGNVRIERMTICARRKYCENPAHSNLTQKVRFNFLHLFSAAIKTFFMYFLVISQKWQVWEFEWLQIEWKFLERTGSDWNVFCVYLFLDLCYRLDFKLIGNEKSSVKTV